MDLESDPDSAPPRSGSVSRKPRDEKIPAGRIALIRAEDSRVLFGVWRGKRLADLEPSGRYEMAAMDLREGESLSSAKATALMKAAIRLNKALGDPTANVGATPKVQRNKTRAARPAARAAAPRKGAARPAKAV